ncbi:MAG TPA: immunoglobulin domain-containing protein [Verrucomicrobiae bacterium]|nr:immunoglobulin domain-containing protein [Verrucomicrobiae bacterium]
MRKFVSIGLFVLMFSFSASLTLFAQTPPPNDNLTNATLLMGTDVTFIGCLAGSTLEDDADWFFDDYVTFPSTGSIWWSWTAPVSTVLNLEVNAPAPYSSILDGIAIFSETNGTTSPAGLYRPPPGSRLLAAGVDHQYLSIPVTAGSNYLIQLLGTGSNNYTIRMVATNVPLIFKQPLSQTVYSNASAIFYVVSGGLQPRSYQWFFNGTNIPGETAPILALTDIDASMTGSYSVLVSNATGSVMSDSATLAISQSNVPPVLAAVGYHSNSLLFSLTGELGRTYRIQSSTNLIDWSLENSFPVPPGLSSKLLSSNLVYTTTSPLLLMVTNSSSHKYYRAYIYKPDSPESEICINNLRQIVIAKTLWSVDNTDFLGSMGPLVTTPAFSWLAAYFAHPERVFCPEDAATGFQTSYYIDALDRFPSCYVDPAHHRIEGVP